MKKTKKELIEILMEYEDGTDDIREAVEKLMEENELLNTQIKLEQMASDKLKTANKAYKLRLNTADNQMNWGD